MVTLLESIDTLNCTVNYFTKKSSWYKNGVIFATIIFYIIVILGIIGNALSGYVLQKLTSRSLHYKILVWIAVFNIAHLSFSIIHVCTHVAGTFDSRVSQRTAEIIYVCHIIAAGSSATLSALNMNFILILSIRQVVMLRYPDFSQSEKVTGIIYKAVIALVFLQIFMVAPMATMFPIDFCYGKIHFKVPKNLFILNFDLLTTFMNIIIPWFIMLFVIACILVWKNNVFPHRPTIGMKSLRKCDSMLMKSFSKLIFGLISLTVVCYFPFVIDIFHIIIANKPLKTSKLYSDSHYMKFLCSSINESLFFIVLLITDRRFKKIVSSCIRRHPDEKIDSHYLVPMTGKSSRLLKPEHSSSTIDVSDIRSTEDYSSPFNESKTPVITMSISSNTAQNQ